MPLRDVVDEDLPIFFEHQRDPDAARMAAFPSREKEAFMAHWNTKVLGDATTRTKTIVVDGQVAGYVASYAHGGKRLICYWIGKEHWGKGVATAALSEFLSIEASRPLFAFVATQNVGSIRVLEKCGLAVSTEAREASSSMGDDVEELLFELVM